MGVSAAACRADSSKVSARTVATVALVTIAILSCGGVSQDTVAAEKEPTPNAQLDLAHLVRETPPRITEPTEATERVQALRSTLQAKRAQAVSPTAVEQDEQIARQRFDLLWSLQTGLKSNPKLDLTPLGFHREREGVFSAQGELAHDLLPIYFLILRTWQDNPSIFDSSARHLRESGFSAEDIETLHEHLQKVSAYTIGQGKHRELMDRLAATVRARRARSEDVSDLEFEAYVYQVQLNAKESEHQFVSGVFALFDSARQRMLFSVLEQSIPRNYHIQVSAQQVTPEYKRVFLDSLVSGAYVEELKRVAEEKKRAQQ